MQRGVMLTASQVVIALMILQSVVFINANVGRHLAELETVEKMKDFEMFSYNIMLDLCYNLKKWAPELGAGADPEVLEVKLTGWINSVKELFKNEGNLELEINDLRMEEYKGQPCDSIQMAFLGNENHSGKYISGALSVRFEWLFVKLHREFRICVAV
ncbi:MAG: hypothetical protein N3D12_05595 [Candidatus Methanomethyliaceae archaeon]|nr:hypothetical protein [Candidatus Methanomethyliaceae archaeon]